MEKQFITKKTTKTLCKKYLNNKLLNPCFKFMIYGQAQAYGKQ